MTTSTPTSAARRPLSLRLDATKGPENVRLRTSDIARKKSCKQQEMQQTAAAVFSKSLE
jgi:hypothetical protein